MNDAPPPLTPTPHPTAPAHQAPPKKSGCGLTGVGCTLGCLALVALCAVGGFLAVTATKSFLGRASEPVPVEEPVASGDEIAAALEQFEKFHLGLAPGGTPVPLSLSGEELNLILFHHPAFEQVRGRVSVDIVADRLSARVSLAFDELPLPEEGFFVDRLKGKYLNGEVALSLGMAEGRPVLHAEGLSVNGITVPEAFMSDLRGQNLLEGVAKDPDAGKFFDRIEDMRIEGGRLHLVPKAAP